MFFIATGEALDDEMRVRIAHHRALRPSEFTTIEQPREIERALHEIDKEADIAVIDCLTLWISNLMGAGADDRLILDRADALARTLSEVPFNTIVVTDEVGAGIVPDNPVARRFRDLLGWTNQKVAAAADRVILMVSGIAMRVK
jgi:adenosylcobinamide kinase / adenosylcobinamide-phosphate guanylyltransferase